MVNPIKTQADLDIALTSPKVVVIDFWAEWCGPCKFIAPHFQNLSVDFEEGAEFYKIDVDEVPKLAEEHNIRAMPTFVIFKDGKRVDEIVGANISSLRSTIQKHL